MAKNKWQEFPQRRSRTTRVYIQTSIQTFPFHLVCVLNNVSKLTGGSAWRGVEWIKTIFFTHMLPKQAQTAIQLTSCVVHMPWSKFALWPAHGPTSQESHQSHPESCFCLEVLSGLGKVSGVLHLRLIKVTDQDIKHPVWKVWVQRWETKKQKQNKSENIFLWHLFLNESDLFSTTG